MIKRALVIGCSKHVWEEVKAAEALCQFDRIYCVKMSGIYWPKGDFTWVGLHPEFMDGYEAERKKLGHPSGYEIVGPLAREVGEHGKKGNITRRVSYCWNSQMTHSSGSGIYGAKVAMEDGFDKIVLAGIPMTAEDGHFAPKTKHVHGGYRGPVWTQLNYFMSGYSYAIPILKKKVRSMSGRTKKDLGAPTAEWLAA